MEESPKHPDVAAIFGRLLEAVGLNAAQFARKIGSTPQAVSNYVVGRNEPGRKMLAQIIEAYPNISAAWLTTGIGEPFPGGQFSQLPAPLPPAIREGFPPVPGTATPAEADFVGRYIKSLEQQLTDAREDMGYLQGLVTELMGKPLASADAAVLMSIPRTVVSGLRPAACEYVEARVVEMYRKAA